MYLFAFGPQADYAYLTRPSKYRTFSWRVHALYVHIYLLFTLTPSYDPTFAHTRSCPLPSTPPRNQHLGAVIKLNAVQAGIDAPHLGVGAVAGDEESYETFKDFMDVVIEGWHGYKPDDKHKIDIDANNIKLTAEQAKKFDQYVISTRIRAGRSIRGLPLPPGTNRAQRRKVRKCAGSKSAF